MSELQQLLEPMTRSNNVRIVHHMWEEGLIITHKTPNECCRFIRCMSQLQPRDYRSPSEDSLALHVRAFRNALECGQMSRLDWVDTRSV
eukprot:6060586-Amphidinium_carterae.2